MKKQIFLLGTTALLSITTISQAQWVPSGHFNEETGNHSIRIFPNDPHQMSLGTAWGLGLQWPSGGGYVGFNMSRYPGGAWNYYSDGTGPTNGDNGGSVIFGRLDGSLHFAMHQTTSNGWGSVTDQDVKDNVKMSIRSDGKVGIGTEYPLDLLTLKGDMGFDPGTTYYNHVIGRSRKFGLVLYANTKFDDGSGVVFRSDGNGDRTGAVTFVSGGETGEGEPVAYEFLQFNNGGYNPHMSIFKNGKVVVGAGIMNNKPDGYKLYVEQGILTEKVKVALSSDPTNWSDFVFDEDYKLMPLSEVESFIEENNHLPEIPTTAEVHANGLDLAQMDAKLLQKVEELTLYIIEQNKRITTLESKLNQVSHK